MPARAAAAVLVGLSLVQVASVQVRAITLARRASFMKLTPSLELASSGNERRPFAYAHSTAPGAHSSKA